MKFKVANKQYIPLLKNIQQYFQNASNSIHKARNEIKIIEFQNQEFIVKSFKIPHFLNRIIYTFAKDSKAEKSYKNSLKIIDFTPKPIGYIEFRKYGLIHDSYFVSEKFEYDFTIREPLLDKNFENKEQVFKQFAQFTFKLHQNNIFHLDYSPGNILIKKEREHYIFKIVDINRMKFEDFDFTKKDLSFSKLWANDEDLRIISHEYAKSANLNREDFFQKALFFSSKHKSKKEFYKKIKGKQ